MLTSEQAKEQRHDMRGPIFGSPWGHVQAATFYAPGITFLETAGHGGFYLTPDKLDAMPAALRKTDDRYCPLSFFEEDCEWALVALAFPDHFTDKEYNEAVRTLFTTYPAQFAAWFASLPMTNEILNALVERLHADRYPGGCPNLCEACVTRLGVF